MKPEQTSVYMIAPLPILHRRTRLKKQADLISLYGLSIRFFGWERIDGEASKNPDSDSHIHSKIILRGGGYGSGLTHLYYFIWMIKVFMTVLMLPRRSSIFCLGFETAFPAIVAGKFKGAQIIFDDADRLSMILSLPGPIKKVVQRLEQWASHSAALHLVPGFSRYEWRSEKMRLLRNCPSTPDFEAAAALVVDIEAELFTLYANGWVGESRGAPIFLELMRRLDGGPFRLKIIGRGDGIAYEKLKSLSNVEVTDEVPQIEALAAYRASDLVLTYYDPSISINRQAESNKWGDCIYLGVPFVVNSEVETAKGLLQNGGCFAVPYDDVDALEKLVRRLAQNPDELDVARTNILQLSDEFRPFDEAFNQILASTPAPLA